MDISGVSSLLQQGVESNRQAFNTNAGISAFSKLVNDAIAMKQGKQLEEEKALREDVSSARTAAYKEYPSMAAERGGLTITPQQEAMSATNAAKTPSWGQEQKVEAVRTGLLRGTVSITSDFGLPTQMPITTLESAIQAVTSAGLDPNLFTKELQQVEQKYYDGIDDKQLAKMLPTPPHGADIGLWKTKWKQATREERIAYLQEMG